MNLILLKAAKVFLNNGMQQIATFSLGVYIVARFGAEGKGVYFLVTTLTSLIAITLSFGLNNALIYFVKKSLISVRDSLIIIIVASIVITFLYLLFLYVGHEFIWHLFFDPMDINTFYLFFIAAYIPIVLVTLFLASYFLVTANTVLHRWLIVGSPVLLFIVIVLIDSYFYHKLEFTLLSLLVVECLFAIYGCIWVLSKESISMDKSINFKDIYNYAIKSYPGSIGNTVLTQVDSLIIAAYLSPTAVGYYSVSKSLYRIILSVPRAFNGLLLGFYSDLGLTKAYKLNLDIMKKMAAALFILGLMGYMFSEYFILWVYGPDFTPAVQVFNILLIAAFFMGTSTSINSFFLSQGMPWLSSKVAIYSSIVSIVSAFVLIPGYGVMGAAYGVLLGAISFFTMRIHYLFKSKL